MTAYDEGYAAYKPDTRAKIPYEFGSREWWDYLRGWCKAKYFVDRGLSE